MNQNEGAPPNGAPHSEADPGPLTSNYISSGQRPTFELGGFQRLSDLLEGGVEPLSWLAESVLTADALGVIGAPPKCFKSWMLADLVVAVASGRPWLRAFPIHRSGTVVLVSPEGGQRGLARRVEAILRSAGATADELDIAFVRTRSLALTDRTDLRDLEAAVRYVGPVLIAVDSIYAAIPGVQASQLTEFGAALRKLTDLGQDVGGAVVISHHLNERRGKGLHRLTGAGPAEWASAAILGARGAHTTVAGITAATVNWSLVARDVPELEFSTTFSIEANDPADLASPLRYDVAVSFGKATTAKAGSADDLSWTDERVLAALRLLDSPADMRRLGDVIANDGNKGLRHETLRSALDRLVERGLADGGEGMWFITSEETLS